MSSNTDFLARHAKSHPYQCVMPIGSPRPEKVHQDYPNMDFICVPIDGVAVWAFAFKSDLEKISTGDQR